MAGKKMSDGVFFISLAMGIVLALIVLGGAAAMYTTMSQQTIISEDAAPDQ